MVGSVRPGKTVDVGILRNGKRETLAVTIEPLDEGQKMSALTKPEPVDESRLGVEVAELTDEQKESLNLDAGVVVSSLSPDGAAAKSGIRSGDIIISLNREEIDDVEELEKLVKAAPADEAIPVLIQRQNAPMFLALTIPSVTG